MPQRIDSDTLISVNILFFSFDKHFSAFCVLLKVINCINFGDAAYKEYL